MSNSEPSRMPGPTGNDLRPSRDGLRPRVDWTTLEESDTTRSEGGAPRATENDATAVRWMTVPLGVLLAATQAAVTVLAVNLRGIWLTSTMIPIFAFAVMFVLTVLLHPVWTAARSRRGFHRLPRPFNRAEMTHLFAAMLVTAGISSYGLSQQLVPLIAAPFNPAWNTPQRGWATQLHPHLNHSLYLTDPEASRAFYEGVTQTPDGRGIRQPPESAPLSAKLAHQATVFALIPWRLWFGPLLAWTVFVAASYGMFFALTYLVLDVWRTREKLIFPISRLAESLLPPADPSRLFTPMLKRFGFWLGFAVSFLSLGFNALKIADLRIRMGTPAWDVATYLQDSSLRGLTGYSSGHPLMFLIIYTAIGLSFLLPTEVTFSVWFYYLLAKLFMLMLVLRGYGGSGDSFPADWLALTNPMTGQGGGAMFLLAAVVMFRTIRDRARESSGLPPRDRLRFMRPVIGLAVSVVMMVAWLNWNHVPILWASIFVLSICLLCVALMRFVAEVGVFWFQTWGGFFHLHRALALGRWLAPTITGPLIPIYSVLFLDVKCVLSGHLLTAAWMQRNNPSRGANSAGRFHLGMVLSIAAALVVSFVTTIFLAYLLGGNQLNGWLFTKAPPLFLDHATDLANAPPAFDAGTAGWYLLGAAWCAVSLAVRASVFWFPHPIGYVMLVNPLISHLWLSCFIGWACKKVVIRYGSKMTFDKTQGFFIGLILGELTSIAFWSLLSLLTGTEFAILDLNRYGA